MAAERFEDRHRELRTQAAGRMAGPSAIPLVRFNRATSGLVDDLVAAVRRDFELNDAIVDEQDERRKTDLVNQRIAAREGLRIILDALDEASGRG